MTASLTVVIVEDEDVQRRQLSAWLATEPSVTVVGEAGTGSAAVSLIDELRPDVALLDIALPELTGLEVLRRVHHSPTVVFTTAYREYAIDAFELGAVDYLLKPFGRDRLVAALERVRDRAGSREGSRDGEASAVLERVESVRDEGGPLTRVFVRNGGAIVPIPVESIVRLEADGDYTAVIAGGRRHLIGMSLQTLHARIRRDDFVRVHRQHVVNLAHVSRFVPYDAARLSIEFTGGGSVVASRAGSQMLRGLVG
jgi:two-component system, LytTR family, response regulator